MKVTNEKSRPLGATPTRGGGAGGGAVATPEPSLLRSLRRRSLRARRAKSLLLPSQTQEKRKSGESSDKSCSTALSFTCQCDEVVSFARVALLVASCHPRVIQVNRPLYPAAAPPSQPKSVTPRAWQGAHLPPPPPPGLVPPARRGAGGASSAQPCLRGGVRACLRAAGWLAGRLTGFRANTGSRP
ncbi:Protein of unknown function [Gryllus bimaculatus]|nr:Protein of unknown function [Gryllus bimaculatus]